MFSKYKLSYIHREDGMRVESSVVIEAGNEDEACDIFERDYEPYLEGFNGLEDCVEVVESPLFKKAIHLDMPDGFHYAIPVEFVARHRARYYAKEYNNDETESLRQDTLPLFESDNYEIEDWAVNSMNWNDVRGVAIQMTKSLPDDAYQEQWVNGSKEIKDTFK